MYVISVPNKSDLFYDADHHQQLREIGKWSDLYCAYLVDELPEDIPDTWRLEYE